MGYTMKINEISLLLGLALPLVLFSNLSVGGSGNGEIVDDAVPTFEMPVAYPRDARVAGLEGEVTVEFVVSDDGSVSKPKVIESIPHRVFDRAAVRAILRLKYGEDKAGNTLRHTFEFTLDE